MDFIYQFKDFSSKIGAPGIHKWPIFLRISDTRLMKLQLLHGKKVKKTEITNILCKVIRLEKKVVLFTVKLQFLTYRIQKAKILHITKHHKEKNIEFVWSFFAEISHKVYLEHFHTICLVRKSLCLKSEQFPYVWRGKKSPHFLV